MLQPEQPELLTWSGQADPLPELKLQLASICHRIGEQTRTSGIGSPEDVYALCIDMASLDQEELHILNLSTRNTVIERTRLYKGSVNSSQVRMSEIFRRAIILNAPAIVIVHNHPSGEVTPSVQDVAVTSAVVKAGELLDIEVLDHIIVGQGCYTSLKTRRLGFK
jgi:DNA repair protein RadC